MDMDQAFIDMMVPHHETAVAAAKVIGTSTERSELKQVAEDMIESRRARSIRCKAGSRSGIRGNGLRGSLPPTEETGWSHGLCNCNSPRRGRGQMKRRPGRTRRRGPTAHSGSSQPRTQDMDVILWELPALLGNEKCVHELGPIASGSGH